MLEFKLQGESKKDLAQKMQTKRNRVACVVKDVGGVAILFPPV